MSKAGANMGWINGAKALWAGSALLAAMALPSVAFALEDDVTCLLRPRHIVQLGSPINGIIAVVSVDRGDRVTRGQVLTRLESTMEEATLKLDQARAADTSDVDIQRTQSVMLGQKFQRTKELEGRKIATTVSLQEVESDYVSSKFKVRAAENHIAIVNLEAQRSAVAVELKRIKSPINGVVIERKLEPGDYVSEQTPIMTIAEIDLLNAEVVAPARLYGSIKVGARAQVLPAQPVGGSYEADVEVVDPVIDAASNTFSVRLVVKNPDGAIPAGLRCDVTWGAVARK